MKEKSQKRLERELKILQVKRNLKQLYPAEAERLNWLEGHFGVGKPPPLPSQRSEASEESSGELPGETTEEAAADGEEEALVTSEAPPRKESPRKEEPRQAVSMSDLFSDTSGASDPGSLGAAPIELHHDWKKEGEAPDLPNDLQGPRQAIVWDRSGLTLKGQINLVDLDATTIQLDPAAGVEAAARELEVRSLDSIQLLLPKGLAPPKPEGKPVRVRLHSGKELKGFTPDYDPKRKAFTVFTKGDRYVERVIVIQGADLTVAFEPDEEESAESPNGHKK